MMSEICIVFNKLMCQPCNHHMEWLSLYICLAHWNSINKFTQYMTGKYNIISIFKFINEIQFIHRTCCCLYNSLMKVNYNHFVKTVKVQTIFKLFILIYLILIVGIPRSCQWEISSSHRGPLWSPRSSTPSCKILRICMCLMSI